MQIKFDINDNKVNNFTEGAIKRIKKEAEKYTNEVIKESKTFTKSIKEYGTATEITEDIVVLSIRRSRHVVKRKNKFFTICIKLSVDLLLLLCAYFLNFEKFKSTTYLSRYFILLIVTVAATLYKYWKEEY